MRNSVGRSMWVSAILVILVLTVGCGTLPITDGFRGNLPAPRSRVVVWGNHPSAVATTSMWLQKRDLEVVEQARLHRLLDDGDVKWINTLKDEAAVLDAAEALPVDSVVFVNQSGDIRAPMVTVRSIDIGSAQVEWSGSARLPGYVKSPFSDTVAGLTCQALATAWGYRDRGQAWFTSAQEMCDLE